ncbi:MAG: hypothetical protein ACOX8G_10695 [Eubacterium sp.]|jgi:hypothetical protein
MNYIVPDSADARTILRNIKECSGSVVIPAAMLRGFLHELQVRRKQMSRPQKKTRKKE